MRTYSTSILHVAATVTLCAGCTNGPRSGWLSWMGGGSDRATASASDARTTASTPTPVGNAGTESAAESASPFEPGRRVAPPPGPTVESVFLPVGSPSDALRASATEDRPPPAPPSVRQVTVRLEVVRIDGPRGSFSGAEPIWQLLDETSGAAVKMLTLRDNGFRVGVARRTAAATLQKRLESIPGVRIARDVASPRPDQPVEINLVPADRDLSVFAFDEKGRVRGFGFENARPYYQIDMFVEFEESPRVTVRLVPEVREPRGPMRFVKTPEGFRQEPEYRGQVFGDLTVEASLAPGEMLVVGPTGDVHGAALLGRAFLAPPADGGSRESLFVFVPRIAEAAVAIGSR